MYSRMAFAAAVVLTAATAAAQEPLPPKAAAAPQDKTVREVVAQLAPSRVPVEARIVKDAPYSAEVVTESVQALPDGNRIVHRTTGRVYRDSQGRLRREDDREPGQPGHISITDPVAGTSYSLDPVERVAWKTPAGVARVIVSKMLEKAPGDPAEVERRRQVEVEIAKAREAELHAAATHAGTEKHATAVQHERVPYAAAVAIHSQADVKTEKLPARNIEGVMAEGVRITRTIPAGAIGNEQPIVSVTEEWRSPELKVLVLTRTSDPRTGDSTYRLQNIVRGEQSASWFEVPADYTVKESGIRRLAPAVK